MEVVLTEEREEAMSAKGYAILSFGQIEVPTISPTRRGAIVNWLVAGPPRLFIHHGMSDDEIERHWRQCQGAHRDHDVIEVDIVPTSSRS